MFHREIFDRTRARAVRLAGMALAMSETLQSMASDEAADGSQEAAALIRQANASLIHATGMMVVLSPEESLDATGKAYREARAFIDSDAEDGQ